ncbi:hypothetical protein TM1040_1661 [Ruegeria sp. TM1040]|jgi:hypothetical protein|uniref:hypothetical protein n=1 Tax=Ruegeria sp. (strain TM1040) TaxID=292414 RepID=UPI0000462371|nr:hypothetical protein [Ruegeria sp. TM1040]ABF64346.1 hypothetical protein TM1040_1613 [Ruegeria sp. TM1040]ABF64394.1 hypothetical protein TM1040_1661 [Ruegeria sp. TM1040]
MDFNKFDSVSAAEKGAAMQLKDPATLAPLFTEDGKPCEVILLGSEAPSVRAAMRELQKARANSQDAEGDTDDEGVSYDQIHDKLVEGLLPRVVGFNNVFNGDKPATKRDAKWFFGLNRFNGQEGEKSFAEQAAEFSAKRGGYLGNASAG